MNFRYSTWLHHKLPHSDQRRFSHNHETAPAHPEFRSIAECNIRCCFVFWLPLILVVPQLSPMPMLVVPQLSPLLVMPQLSPLLVMPQLSPVLVVPQLSPLLVVPQLSPVLVVPQLLPVLVVPQLLLILVVPSLMLLVPWLSLMFTDFFYNFISQVSWPFIRLCQNISGEGLGAFVECWWATTAHANTYHIHSWPGKQTDDTWHVPFSGHFVFSLTQQGGCTSENSWHTSWTHTQNLRNF